MTRRLRTAGRVAVATIAALLPRAALACPVCFAAEKRTIAAYIATTVVLSLLPLGLMGGIVALLYVRTRRAGQSTAGTAQAPDAAMRAPATGRAVPLGAPDPG